MGIDLHPLRHQSLGARRRLPHPCLQNQQFTVSIMVSVVSAVDQLVCADSKSNVIKNESTRNVNVNDSTRTGSPSDFVNSGGAKLGSPHGSSDGVNHTENVQTDNTNKSQPSPKEVTSETSNGLTNGTAQVSHPSSSGDRKDKDKLLPSTSPPNRGGGHYALRLLRPSTATLDDEEDEENDDTSNKPPNKATTKIKNVLEESDDDKIINANLGLRGLDDSDVGLAIESEFSLNYLNGGDGVKHESINGDEDMSLLGDNLESIANIEDEFSSGDENSRYAEPAIIHFIVVQSKRSWLCYCC